MPMSLWDLIEKYRDDTGATEAAILRRADLNKGTFTAWRKRGIPTLPDRGQLLRLAAALKVDYETLLTAVLHDVKYLPEETAREEQARLDEAETTEWRAILTMAQEIFAEAEGDADRLPPILRKRFAGRQVSSSLIQNALEYINGTLRPPRRLGLAQPDLMWLEPGGHVYFAEAKRMSAGSGKTGDLVAAHEEEGSISGEQEQPTEP